MEFGKMSCEDLLDRTSGYLNESELEKAIATLSKYTSELDPTSPEYYYYMGILHAKMGDLASCLSNLEACVKLSNADAQLMSALRAAGQISPDLACAIVPAEMAGKGNRGASSLLPNLLFPARLPSEVNRLILQRYSDNFELLYDQLVALDRNSADQLLVDDFALNGSNYWHHVAMGHASWMRAERSQADAHYAKAKALSMSQGVWAVHFNCGVYSWLSQEQVNGLENAHVENVHGTDDWRWHHPVNLTNNPEVTLVFGCDIGYFHYVPKLLETLIAAKRSAPQSPETLIVIGVAEVVPELVNFLEDVSAYVTANVPGLHLCFAYGKLKRSDDAVFTCIRYLLLPDIVAKYNSRLIIADIDAYFPEDFFRRLREIEPFDFGFRLYAFDEAGRQRHGQPWGFGAGITLLGRNDITPKFARFLANYIQIAYDRWAPTNWCIDQCALAQAFDIYVRPRWHDFAIKFMDNGEPLLVMPHHVGGKAEFKLQGDLISTQNFWQKIDTAS
ncbi:tetratricopeptide repeat protein [Labrys sp. 22185]|uniref:tetratricopeptide repeat protein n=1 Tax=Labrys sp. 22185 TaxID=3453888 RepID=UPI003F8352B0